MQLLKIHICTWTRVYVRETGNTHQKSICPGKFLKFNLTMFSKFLYIMKMCFFYTEVEDNKCQRHIIVLDHLVQRQRSLNTAI